VIEKMRRRRPTLWLALAVGVLAIFMMSCDRHTRIPSSQWENQESRAGDQWDVTTHEAIYRVQRFAATDSTVIIEEASEALYYAGEAYPPGLRRTGAQLELPMTIPYGEVKSIERVEFSGVRTTLLTVGIAAGVGAVVWFLASMPAIPAD